MEGARQALAVLLAVVAGFAAVAGAAAWQLRDAVVEPRGFGDRAAEALDRPAVRRAVTDEVLARVLPAGVADEPAVAGAVDTAAGTPAFRAAFRRGAEDLHAQLVARDRRSATLQLDVGGALAEADPRLAAVVGPRTVEVAAVSAADLPVDPARVADPLDTLPTVLLPLACFALAGALLVAHHRRGAVLAAAVAVAVAGGLLLVALQVGRSTALDAARAGVAVDRAQARDAVGALWDVLAGGLTTTALVALVGGVVAAAVAAIPWGGGRSAAAPAGATRRMPASGGATRPRA